MVWLPYREMEAIENGLDEWMRLIREPCRYCGEEPAGGVHGEHNAQPCCDICREIADEPDPVRPMRVGSLCRTTLTDKFEAHYRSGIHGQLPNEWTTAVRQEWGHYRGRAKNNNDSWNRELKRGMHARPGFRKDGLRHGPEGIAMIMAMACGYCGKGGPSGIDRYDNDAGYLVGNLVPCCTVCNMAKGAAPIELFLAARKAIADGSRPASEVLSNRGNRGEEAWRDWADRGERWAQDHAILVF